MENNIINLKDYTPSSSDCFFLDNNIWMFLFCPLGNCNKRKQQCYSRFLSDIKSHRATIYINSMVLSEFANAYLRLDYQLWMKEERNSSKKYKRDYLKSDKYKDTISTVQSAMKAIIKLAERMPDNFNSINIENVFNYFSIIDFNDSYFIEYCKSYGKTIILVSDDKDYSLVDCGKLKILRDNTFD